MHQSPEYRTEIKRRRRMMLTAACLATLIVPAANVTADSPQCGCSDGCEGGHGPIYKALDTVAGGIEKLLFLGLKHRSSCDEMACDGGCDAMSMSEMMMYEDSSIPSHMAPPVRMSPMTSHPPMPQHSHPQPMSSQHMSAPPTIQHSDPALPPTAAPLRMSKPQMTSIPEQTPSIPRPMPRPMPLPLRDDDATGSGVMPLDRSEGDSLFDSLQDPFRDDAAQLNAPRIDREGSTKTLPASYRTSSRRVIKSR